MKYILGAITFLIFLYSLPPTVAPYRDAGELSIGAKTLSVLHPPGYPLYSILGKFFYSVIPIGNTGYRLNLMSSIFSSISIILLYEILLTITGNKIISFFLPLFFALTPEMFQLSIVSESYSPDIFFIIFLIYLIIRKKNLYLISFIMGIALTNRLSLLLTYPALLYFIFKEYRINSKTFLNSFLFFILGLSVYLYMPIRSIKEPFIDWANPQNFSNFLYSITRKAYGHSLDKISEFYNLKDVIFPQLKYFILSLFKISPLIFIAGFFSFFKIKTTFQKTIFILFFLTGPIFLIISKMPANPHALVIVSASYLIPELSFIILSSVILKSFNKKILIPVFGLSLIFSIFINKNIFIERYDFFSWDYATNIFKTLTKNSAVFLRKDVQLFSSWYYQKEKNIKIPVIAQGMAKAFWYKSQLKKRYNLKLPETSVYYQDNVYFKKFIALNRNLKIYSNSNFEMKINSFYEEIKLTPTGFLYLMDFKKHGPKSELFEFYFFHMNPFSTRYRNFYWKDLLSDYAESLNSIGLDFYFKNKLDKAIKFFRLARMFSDKLGIIDYNLAITYYLKKDFEKAEIFNKNSLKKYYSNYIDKRTWPFIVNDLVKIYNNLGAIEEKKNKLDEAIKYYEKALQLKPNFAQGYYNLGVVYWKKKDFKKVIYYFKKTLVYNPEHKQARFYLEKLKK